MHADATLLGFGFFFDGSQVRIRVSASSVVPIKPLKSRQATDPDRAELETSMSSASAGQQVHHRFSGASA